MALTERWAWVAFAREIALIGAGIAAIRAIGAIERDPGLAARATEAIAARGLGPTLQRLAVGAIIARVGIRGAPRRARVDGHRADARSVGTRHGLRRRSHRPVRHRRRRPARGRSAPARARGTSARARVCGGRGIGLVTAIAIAITTRRSCRCRSRARQRRRLPVGRAARAIARSARLARRGRRALTLAVFGGPVAMLAALATEGRMPGVGPRRAARRARHARHRRRCRRSSKSRSCPPRAASSTRSPTRRAPLTSARRARRSRRRSSASARRRATEPRSPSSGYCILHASSRSTPPATSRRGRRELPPVLLDIAQGEPGERCASTC